MPIYEPIPNVSVRRRVRAINGLLATLKRYRGGEIVKGKHPVHKAVCVLERMCYKKIVMRGKQLYVLPNPLKMLWFRMVHCSRPVSRQLRPAYYADTLRERATPDKDTDRWIEGRRPRPDIAMEWRTYLIDGLKAYRAAVVKFQRDVTAGEIEQAYLEGWE